MSNTADTSAPRMMSSSLERVLSSWSWPVVSTTTLLATIATLGFLVGFPLSMSANHSRLVKVCHAVLSVEETTHRSCDVHVGGSPSRASKSATCKALVVSPAIATRVASDTLSPAMRNQRVQRNVVRRGGGGAKSAWMVLLAFREVRKPRHGRTALQDTIFGDSARNSRLDKQSSTEMPIARKQKRSSTNM